MSIRLRVVVCLLVSAIVCLLTSHLARAAEYPPAPYEVHLTPNVMVEMRDGVKLAVDLYTPIKDGQPLQGPLPVVLQRTPYNKTGLASQAKFFASHGYLSAIQDCRGRFQSEGEFFPFVDDPKDGYDTIEWLAKLPRSSGKVGMYGCSYMAWVQFEAATQNPPSLKAMIPYEGPINGYHYSQRYGGALHLGLLKWILSVARTDPAAKQNQEAAQAVREMESSQTFLEWSARIPWQRGETPLKAFPRYEEAAMNMYFENHEYNDFWRQPGLGMSEYFDKYPDIPTLWVVGWYDWYPRTICDGYQQMVKLGHHHQHLLVGPWTHNNFNAACGDVNFGTQGAKITNYEDYLHAELAWFDRWLRDKKDAPTDAPVRIFVMGGGDGRRGPGGRLNHGGQWREFAQFPPAESKPTPFYLQPGGALSNEKPAASQSASSYDYDPRNTVSSNGRCITAYGPASKSGFSGMGPRDQIEIETLPGHGTPGGRIVDREDVLVFETEPLQEDTQMVGNMKALLWVSSDAPDTDFFVKLLDVHPQSEDYPSGYSLPVSEGILRARYREGFEKQVLMKPRQIYQIEIPLEPGANVFQRGHRIRIYICSSNFPNFDINPNTGDPNNRTPRVAHNTIHHDAEHPSQIVLPLLQIARNKLVSCEEEVEGR